MVLYLDPASPYAYLAAERAERVLGTAPQLETVVLGAIFRVRGWGSWALTDARAEGMAEVERRAREYGLPLVWPAVWPANSLHASRLVVWADRHGALRETLLALLRAGFAEGRDIADHAVLRDVAAAVGLPAGEVDGALADQAIKDDLRRRTDEAVAAGVRGVPTLRIGDRLLFGDDRLEEAATTLGA